MRRRAAEEQEERYQNVNCLLVIWLDGSTADIILFYRWEFLPVRLSGGSVRPPEEIYGSPATSNTETSAAEQIHLVI